MKIARFSTGDEPRYGIVELSGASPTDPASFQAASPGSTPPATGTDIATAIPEPPVPGPAGQPQGHILVLKGDPLFTPPQATGEVVDLAEARLLSPVIPRSKVVGFAGTYVDPAGGDRREGAPDEPVVFLKPNTAVIGPDAPIVLPRWSTEVHYEAELAVVIKSLAKDITPERVDDVVLGYTVANDVSARDRQRAEPQWVRGKAFDTSCPLGPWLEIPEPGGAVAFNPDDAVVRAYLDGHLVQEASTREMTRPVAELVAYASTIFTLLPGDVILTGTPVGAGELRPGQRIEVGVEGIGAFSNPVVRR
ncbi:fumarylacetoacetate hydrolase family protein [Actinomyces bowdenii]|uniref:Fumarylacetoacetate hydrolase family protein n=1 Tax=Actinomyces bowdenii TaxID=131109 RepID=A0A853EIP0_9ACTO|nr:fumarylacetoacetate hydrolase family protein [Actinomyces bowdenii]MBF0696442.1 fumarylacetoacetate hydrolase family protein [Actinomyces bowdenii]NYS68615.1 fumarylacetoacetate hydrolase family protein [Actinomyces bowdenii]